MQIEALRKEINQIDEQLVDLFRKRMNVSKQIGEYKKAHQLPILDQAREKAIILKLKEQYGSDKLYPYIESLYKHIMALSKDIQHG